MKKTLVIAAALLVAAIGALWLQPDGTPSTALPALAERRLARPDTATATAADVGDDTPAGTPSSIPVATGQRADADTLARAMAQRAHDEIGPRFVDYLANQGLSRADGESIVAELMHKLATCSFDAFRNQAAAQGIAFDELLDALEAAFYDADGSDVAAIIDVEAVSRREMPCATNVLQQAGISPSATLQLLRQDGR